MLLRLAAVVGGLAPALVLVLMVDGAAQIALAVALGLAGLAATWRSDQRPLAITGVILAGAAAALAPSARTLLPLTGLSPSPPTVRLSAEPFPEPPPPFAAVEGWFRAEWTLDEYATPEGKRPNQAELADAMLVPFVGTSDDIVRLRGAAVVARVAAGSPPGTTLTTIYGRVKPLPPGVLDALIATVSPTGAAIAPRGVLVDTLDVPQPAEAWTRLVLVLLLALAGAGCLLFATRAQSRGASNRSKSTASAPRTGK